MSTPEQTAPPPPTLAELARLVAEMRQSQTKYFKARTADNLRRAVELEKQVDAAVARILDPQLF